MSESQRRAELADYSRRLHARGWVANHDGNVSCKLEAGRYLITPTATSKAEVTPDSLCVVDDSGARVSGRTRPPGEVGLHVTVYRNRPDVGAVIHAHPPTATGFAVAGVALDQAFLPEAVVSLGPSIPTVPFAAPGPSACQALAPYLLAHDAVLMAGHGVLAWGFSIEQAYLRLELVEHLARIALVARQLGGVKPLPASAIPPLLDARAKAGLGLAASQPPAAAPVAAAVIPAPAQSVQKKVVVACAPAPPGSDVEVYDPKRNADLATIIRQEIVAALKKA